MTPAINANGKTINLVEMSLKGSVLGAAKWPGTAKYEWMTSLPCRPAYLQRRC